MSSNALQQDNDLASIYDSECLPLVENTFSLFPEISLKNVCIIGAQHLLPTTLQMFESFFNRGLNPKNVYLIGKCYSTDPNTYLKMLGKGMHVCSSSFSFSKDSSFDLVYKNNIHKFFSNFIVKFSCDSFEKLIILDDGGELISLIKQEITKFPDVAVVAVEQTSSGINKIQDQRFSFPVINVARSKSKLIYESPLVAQTVSDQIFFKVALHSIKMKKLLIVGNGAIGQSIFKLLNNHFDVDVFDVNSNKSSLSSNELVINFDKYDCIIGCTGKTILKSCDFFRLKKGAILISASSSDREFEVFPLRKKIKSPIKCHDDLYVDDIHIFNCGFPINFCGKASLTDPIKFQLTRALLTSAILNGLNGGIKNRGLTPLNKSHQRFIDDQFKKQLINQY